MKLILHLLDQVKRGEIKERKYHGHKLMLARMRGRKIHSDKGDFGW